MVYLCKKKRKIARGWLDGGEAGIFDLSIEHSHRKIVVLKSKGREMAKCVICGDRISDHKRLKNGMVLLYIECIHKSINQNLQNR